MKRMMVFLLIIGISSLSLFAQVKDITETNSVENTYFNTNLPGGISENYSKKVTYVSIGFGQSIVRTERSPYIEIMLGGRINYALTDLIENEDQPIKDGVYNTHKPADFSLAYSNYEETRPLSIQITIEFNYFFAVSGTADCGRKAVKFFP